METVSSQPCFDAKSGIALEISHLQTGRAIGLSLQDCGFLVFIVER